MRLTSMLLLGAAAGISTGCAADVMFNCAGNAPMCDILEVTADSRRRASAITVTRVAIAQGVHTDIMDERSPVEPGVPIVARRDAVVRVFVEPQADFTPREITARVTLYRDGTVIGAAQAEARPVGLSDLETMSSTINVRIPGAMMRPGDIEWEVELLEAEGVSSLPGSTAEAIFPPQGALPTTLEIEDGGPSLRVYLVPVSWDEDGSGQLPVTNENAVETFRQYLYAIFPVADVEIEVAEPMPWDQRTTITSTTLQAVTELREQRDVDPDQYIYGLLNPSIGAGGGAAGLSWVGNQRAAIGLSLAEGAGAGTMAHELGHSHGRPHSPGCGAAGPDENYPHEDSSIGTYGYNLNDDSLLGPQTYKDLMSYCGPEWVSDYNFIRFFERQKTLFEQYVQEPDAGSADRRRGTAWRMVWLHTDGSVVNGSVTWMQEQPEGEYTELVVDGEPMSGVFAHFTHADGGVLYVPTDAPVDVISVDGAPEMSVTVPEWRK